MIGKKPRPVIGNLITGKLGSSGLMDQVGTSPRTPLDFKIQSPRSLKNYDLGGVGLGIVAALEKSSHHMARFLDGKSRNINKSDPIPISSPAGDSDKEVLDENDEMSSLEEEFTYVTRRNPDKSSYTRVYRNGYEYYDVDTKMVNRKTNAGDSIFDISPAKFCDFTTYPEADFLSACHLCKKKLHGKDIYMYRGEKGFCSKECRYYQIEKDEKKEKCTSSEKTSSSSRSISSKTPCSNNKQMFSTGIFAI